MNATQQQQQRDPYADFSGTLAEVDAINARLAALSTKVHLLTPSTTCAPPPGCAVSFTMIKIDPATESHSVGGGKRSLLRSALLRLANAAGFTIDPRSSGRCDDGRHPHVVHWHSTAAWRDLSGAVVTCAGDCLMDLRDGSAQALEVMSSARGDTPQERQAKGARTLQAMRAKVLEHAQSKSELRALRRALAIRAFTEQELREKPFCVARLVYIGHDEDPDVARENARAIREQMLGGVRALFGPPAEPTFRARVLAPAPTPTRALPPARVADADIDDDAPDAEVVDLPSPAPQPARPSPPAAATVCSRCGGKREVCPVCMKLEGPHAECGDQVEWKPCPDCCPSATTMPSGRDTAPAAFDTARHVAPQRDASVDPLEPSGFTIPGGRSKGTAIEEADDEDLIYWVRRIDGDLEKGKTDQRYADRDRKLLAAMRAVLAHRSGDQPDEPPPPDDFF